MTHRRAAVSMAGVRLAGTGIAMPRRAVTNDDLSKTVDTNDQWITKRTGIRKRHLANPSESERVLAKESLEMALRSAKISPNQLNLVIVATMTPSMCCPSTAARVAAEVGATPAGAMDISAACSGFVYGINLAATLIRIRSLSNCRGGRFRNA